MSFNIKEFTFDSTCNTTTENNIILIFSLPVSICLKVSGTILNISVFHFNASFLIKHNGLEEI